MKWWQLIDGFNTIEKQSKFMIPNGNNIWFSLLVNPVSLVVILPMPISLKKLLFRIFAGDFKWNPTSKKFVCPSPCRKEYCYKRDILRHQRTSCSYYHTKSPLIICQHCSYCTRRPYLLKYHMKKRHNNTSTVYYNSQFLFRNKKCNVKKNLK